MLPGRREGREKGASDRIYGATSVIDCGSYVIGAGLDAIAAPAKSANRTMRILSLTRRGAAARGLAMMGKADAFM